MTQYQRLLIIGDIFVLLFVILFGRLSHGLSVSDIGQWSLTAVPFVIGWCLVMPWTGIYRISISRDLRKLLSRLAIGWGLIGCPVALMIRSILLERSVVGGIFPSFAVVMFLTTTSAILIWRLACIRWLQPKT